MFHKVLSENRIHIRRSVDWYLEYRTISVDLVINFLKSSAAKIKKVCERHEVSSSWVGADEM
ncbi:hypothetical protein ACSBR2_014675 [Camellia fascicularis]